MTIECGFALVPTSKHQYLKAVLLSPFAVWRLTLAEADAASGREDVDHAA